VNQQIKDELEVSAQEIKLADAKRINGLRAVFGEVCSLTQLDIPSSHVSLAYPVVSHKSCYKWTL
jgi:alanyl-tRNA synthetase